MGLTKIKLVGQITAICGIMARVARAFNTVMDEMRSLQVRRGWDPLTWVVQHDVPREFTPIKAVSSATM